MGFIKRIFNRENPFLIQFSLLSFVGLWHVDSDKRWMRIGYSIYKFFAIFSLMSLIIMEINDISTYDQDPLKLAEKLCATTITCTITTKAHLMLRRTDEFYELQKKLKEFNETKSKNPEDVKLIQNTSEKVVNTAKVFVSGAVLGVFFWSIHPLLYEDRKLPFPLKLPFDMEKSPNYEILYCYLVMLLVMFAMSAVATALGFSSYVTMINAQFDVLKQKIERITEERDKAARTERFWKEFNTGKLTHPKQQTPDECEKEEKRIQDAKTMEILGDVIETHNFIYDEVNSFKSLQNTHLMVHIVGIVFGVVVIETAGSSDSFGIHMAKRFLVLGMAIVDILLICYFGEHLENKSCEIAESLYKTPWYEMDVKIQKVILVMCVRAQRPCILKAGNTIRINLATYLNILRVGYNFMLLLRHTVKNS